MAWNMSKNCQFCCWNRSLRPCWSQTKRWSEVLSYWETIQKCIRNCIIFELLYWKLTLLFYNPKNACLSNCDISLGEKEYFKLNYKPIIKMMILWNKRPKTITKWSSDSYYFDYFFDFYVFVIYIFIKRWWLMNSYYCFERWWPKFKNHQNVAGS